MPTFWTYADVVPDSDLEQGDFLIPSAGVREILERVHPHFCAPKYVGFLVASQSCDLVRRDGQPAARYISVAVVRPLRQVIAKLIDSVCTAVQPGVFPVSSKDDAVKLLDRVVNQNEEALGMFYMHPDEELELGDPSVAFLRVTVSLKAEHYSLLVDARRGRLRPEYQAKLGWLVGNLYARPAAGSWSEKPGGRKEQSELVASLLAETDTMCWVDDAKLAAARSSGELTGSLAPREAKSVVERQKVKRPIDQTVDIVVRQVTALWEKISDPTLKQLEYRTRNDPELAGLLSDDSREVVLQRVLALAKANWPSLSEKNERQLRTALMNDPSLRQLIRVK